MLQVDAALPPEIMATPILRVTYMDLCQPPSLAVSRSGPERISGERLARPEYLTLYRDVGEALRWDQRLLMPSAELEVLLAGTCLSIYVLRNAQGKALGFCEFDRTEFPQIELKNFGLVPEARGRGLGPWLLLEALREEWKSGPTRIWLHTDTWDHPAAISVYEAAGFSVYAVRDEAAGPL
jgi:ribosomal protein S18 acetylase RimI-like enzyme